MTGSGEDPPLLGHQGEDVTGRDDIAWALGGIHRHGDGVGPVVGRNAGRHPLAGLNGDGEGGPVLGAVLDRHRRQAQLARPLGGDRKADQAPSVLGHEVDLVWCGELRRDDHVTLVFAILRINQDVRAALAGVLDDVFDRGDGRVAGHGRRSPASGRGSAPACRSPGSPARRPSGRRVWSPPRCAG